MRYSKLFLGLAVIGLAFAPASALAKQKKKKAHPPISVAKGKALDMMAVAKELTTAAGDDPHFGEKYGALISNTPQGRTYHPTDQRITSLLVVFEPNRVPPRGVAMVNNPQKPLTLKDVEAIFGKGKEMPAPGMKGFTGYRFEKINGQYPVEPVAYVSASAKDVKPTTPIFRMLLRRLN